VEAAGFSIRTTAQPPIRHRFRRTLVSRRNTPRRRRKTAESCASGTTIYLGPDPRAAAGSDGPFSTRPAGGDHLWDDSSRDWTVRYRSSSADHRATRSET
jgi:hypothetical protein